MTEFNKDFYPTPDELIYRMLRKTKTFNDYIFGEPYILEPSAGKGNIVDFMKAYYYQADLHFNWAWRTDNGELARKFENIPLEKMSETAQKYAEGEIRDNFEEKLHIHCIESDPVLRNVLEGKECNLVGNDFLSFETEEKYDLIIANFPFSEGDKHMLKALSVLEKFGGEMVALVNANTINNPFCNTRKQLSQKLEQYHADIEFIQGAFADAERSTDVDVALVYVSVPEPEKSSLLLENLKEEPEHICKDEEYSKIVSSDTIEGIVARYREEVRLAKMLINEYLSVQPFLTMSFDKKSYRASEPSLKLTFGENHQEISWSNFNEYLKKIRYKYWYLLFHEPVFMGNLTSNLKSEYFSRIGELAKCEFSLSNIYQVKINILKSVVKGLEDTIITKFDELSYQHSMGCEGNVHLFSGWKTNNAFKINTKVVVPYMRTWDDIWKKFTYRYDFAQYLWDLEKVMEFFDDHKFERSNRSIDYWLNYYEDQQQTKNMEFNYFKVTVYKKGTAHITFTDQKLLDKFNLFGCMHKGFLPPSYGKKKYADMSQEEKDVIDSFQGQKSYDDIMKKPDDYILDSNQLLMLEGK